MSARLSSAACAALFACAWLIWACSVGAQTPAPLPVSISGSPSAAVEAWQSYAFVAQVTADPMATLSFSIQNLPEWTTFDAATGALSGTPTPNDVGIYTNIIISVTDGVTEAELPPFSIVVSFDPTLPAQILSWTPATENSDGSPLTNLAGYRIFIGPSPDELQPLIALQDAGATSYELLGLAPGQYFFALTTLTTSGTESDLSPIVPATIE